MPGLEQLSEAIAKHFVGSDVHLILLRATPSGDLNSLMLVDAQPEISRVVRTINKIFMRFNLGAKDLIKKTRE